MNNIIIENILSELDKGNFKDAIKSCNELLLNYPGNPELYKLRGICNYNLSNLEEARADFKKVIELNPGAPDILRKKIDAIETILKKKKSDESEIPDFDVTKVFQNVPFTGEDTFLKDPQEGFIEGKDIVSANLLRLHSEIEELKDEEFRTVEEIKDTKIKDARIIDNERITVEEIKPTEETKDTVINPQPFNKDDFDSRIPARVIPVDTELEPYVAESNKVEYSVKEGHDFVHRGVFSSPLFFLILVFAVLLIIIFLIYSLMKTDPLKKVQNALNDSLKNSVKKEVLKDTLKPSETDNQTEQKKDETETKEAVKESEAKREPVKQGPVKQEPVREETKKETAKEEPKQDLTLPHTLGFISQKQKFILIQEKDGYWIQAGSYKEKSKAEIILSQIEKKGIKGEIKEADLGEKGIYYRVRFGSFGSQEEAKQKTTGLE